MSPHPKRLKRSRGTKAPLAWADGPARKRGRGRTIKALVFDFDGLIVDTEVPIFRAWQRIYREHGQELPLDRWLTIIGTSSGSFDPVQELGDRIGEHLDEAALDKLERRFYAEPTARQQLLRVVAACVP